SYHHEHGENNDGGNIRTDRQTREQEIGGIHAQHQKITVGHVDDLDYAEDQVQTDADQRVNAAKQDPAGQDLQANHVIESPHLILVFVFTAYKVAPAPSRAAGYKSPSSAKSAT